MLVTDFVNTTGDSVFDNTLKQDDWHTGILYCAMTRATLRLELIVHEGCPWLEVFKNNLDA